MRAAHRSHPQGKKYKQIGILKKKSENFVQPIVPRRHISQRRAPSRRSRSKSRATSSPDRSVEQWINSIAADNKLFLLSSIAKIWNNSASIYKNIHSYWQYLYLYINYITFPVNWKRVMCYDELTSSILRPVSLYSTLLPSCILYIRCFT